jgi:hypothetical protein
MITKLHRINTTIKYHWEIKPLGTLKIENIITRSALEYGSEVQIATENIMRAEAAKIRFLTF